MICKNYNYAALRNNLKTKRTTATTNNA
jgi:hypothetical protein